MYRKIIGLILSALLLINGSAIAADKVFYYHTDPVGTPLAMTDSIGNVLWQADYRPFGEEQEAPGLIDNDRTFVGKEKDKESGLHYFGARYLKDDIGRFLAVDPVGAVDARSNTVNEKLLLNPQRLNAYAYALNNPYKYVDADGKFAWVIVPVVIAMTLMNDHPANAPAPGEATIAPPSLGQGLAGEAIAAATGYGVGRVVGAVGGKIISKSIGNAAHNAADSVRLTKSLASEAQMNEVGRIMAGAGSPQRFRDAGRIAKQYGGSPADWVKKTSSSFTARDGVQFETHWVENIWTGRRVEFKTKFIGGD